MTRTLYWALQGSKQIVLMTIDISVSEIDSFHATRSVWLFKTNGHDAVLCTGIVMSN